VVAAGVACKITTGDAARRIESARENRQSILGQLGSFETPTAATDRMVTILQQALQQSIEADRRYHDGFLTAKSTTCPLSPNSDFELAAKSNSRATAAKQRFVAAFDPLAQRFHRRTWSASEF
jgi:hypothetical protein